MLNKIENKIVLHKENQNIFYIPYNSGRGELQIQALLECKNRKNDVFV